MSVEVDESLTRLLPSNLLPPPSLNPPSSHLTTQDVDTAYSEAGHTPTDTDYYYEETLPLPDGEVVEEEAPLQVTRPGHAQGQVDLDLVRGEISSGWRVG